MVVGASIGAGAFLASRMAAPTLPPTRDGADDVVSWQTDVVALAATSFTIDANGLRFTGTPSTTVRSDPGDLAYWTLEAAWSEHGREQRLNLYFNADQSSWWINEVRVYDGSAGTSPQWATFSGGPWARTPLGISFSGDLDLHGTSSTGPVTLHLGGLRIAVRPQDPITRPIGGGITLTENGNPAIDGDPFDPGGPLHCSGILQLVPKAAELRLLALGYRLSWRWEYSTGGDTGYSEVRQTAPDTGWITDTAVGTSGELIVFVADPARPFGGPARGLPADCPASAP
jgi:hypothetical protein